MEAGNMLHDCYISLDNITPGTELLGTPSHQPYMINTFHSLNIFIKFR